MGVKAKEWKGDWWVFVNHRGKRKAVKCASRKAAEQIRDQIDARLKLGDMGFFEQPKPEPVLTFKEYAERWLESSRARVKPNSIAIYTERLRLRLLPSLGALRLDQITRETVRSLVSQLIATPHHRSNGPHAKVKKVLAHGTIRETLRTLGAILNAAVEDGLMASNPAQKPGKYLGSGVQEEVEVFSEDELARLLQTARDAPFDGYYPFVLCLARAGLRLGEAIALRWEDVDFERRLMIIRGTAYRGQISTTKSNKVRRVDMSLQLLEAFRSLKSIQEAEAVVAGVAPAESVFSTPEGQIIRESNFRGTVWTKLCRQAEVRYRKPHTLRHTYASLLIEAGVPLTYLQKQLGHHSAAFTLKVYGHLIPQKDRAVDVLDDATGRNPRATNQGVAVAEMNGSARLEEGR